ncbi:hypothetical protein M0R45_036067 [Rubus argutus]|uniref:Uncharacterized protein n=1 Tax=Rubus argutus TaxID=59490 RepID=A0AAW1VWH3_RUBAR
MDRRRGGEGPGWFDDMEFRAWARFLGRLATVGRCLERLAWVIWFGEDGEMMVEEVFSVSCYGEQELEGSVWVIWEQLWEVRRCLAFGGVDNKRARAVALGISRSRQRLVHGLAGLKVLM